MDPPVLCVIEKKTQKMWGIFPLIKENTKGEKIKASLFIQPFLEKKSKQCYQNFFTMIAANFNQKWKQKNKTKTKK